ncbi:MAG: hypothetical protein ABI580_07980 [Burkholderiaceae bacterium]
MNTSRARIVVLDNYERALRRLADWSEIERRADLIERLPGRSCGR